MKKLFLFFFVLGAALHAQAQPVNDPTLFSVNGDEVNASEFKYIYEKNNGSKADFSRTSLQEYLDLYVNFKLKVKKAKDLGLSEDANLKRELEGYRKQLSSSYLTDREIVEKLVKEAYQRSKRDVRVSHILIRLNNNATDEEVAQALKTIEGIKSQANAGNFAQLAKQHSQDPSAQENGGDVGFFTVFQLPYELENVVYNIKEGEVSSPVRTQFGWHIALVTASRPARGQVQVAHVLLRTKAGDDTKNAEAAKKVQEAYNELKAGAKFEDVVQKYTEDNTSKAKDGVIGWFGINKYDQAFEDACFALAKDGDYTSPIQSNAGWHIVRRMKMMTNPSYEEVKTELGNKVKKDARFEQVRTALVERIKRENKFQLDETAKKQYIGILTDSFFNYQWKAPVLKNPETVLFMVGDKAVTLQEFNLYCERSPIERSQGKVNTGGKTPTQNAVDKVLDKFVSQVCLEYEESQLDKKYPEYRYLMREYEEGILLFEATKRLVWDKASADEAGLGVFYGENKNKYKWAERARVTTYTIKTTDGKQIEAVRKLAKKKSFADVAAKFNTVEKLVTAEEATFEKGKNPVLDKMAFKKGTMGEPVIKDGAATFIKIEEILAPSVKTLQEARGYVVADYQDHLEKEWVKELRNSYKVNIDQKIFDSLVKK